MLPNEELPRIVMRKTTFSTTYLILAWLVLGPLIGSTAFAAGINLLTNPSATAPLATGWTVIANGGSGWATSTTGGGQDGVGGKFYTSFGLCSRSQTIDLLAKGMTAAELDAAPPLRVQEYFQSEWENLGVKDGYYIKVELRSATGTVISSWNVGTSTALKTVAALNVWYLETHDFTNYGPGVRYIYFEDGGQDNGNWQYQYGANMDGASVSVINSPPSDVALSRSAFASNAPAGGLIGFLSATDIDDSVHTFALAAEVSPPILNLITAGATGWRFFDGTTAVAANWTETTMDDSGWGTGPAPLGYDSTNADTWQKTKVGYGASSTAKPFTAYVRKSFTVASPQDVLSLSGTLMVDDGCVIYLNGHEVYRENLPPVGTPITSTTPATAAISGGDESDYKAWSVPADKLIYLNSGTNVLAVEVHQNAVGSSDMSIDVTLDAAVTTTTNNYDNALFTVVDNQLRLAQSASSTGTGNKTVRVQATDSIGNSFYKKMTISPLGVAFTAPPTALGISYTAFLEHLPLTTVLGTFSSTDADANDAVSYELVSGTGSTDNGLFVIHGNKLYATQVTDFETKPALSIRVRAMDSVGLSTTATFNLTLIDDTTEDDDGDGLPESAEDVNNNGIVDPGETSPYLADTDGDGFSDKLERDNGSSPTNPASTPTSVPLRQIVSHNTGDSWLTAASWEGGVAPSALTVAIVANSTLTFRPPPTADPVFPGIGVELSNGALFRLKHTGLASISKIKLDNATIQQGMTLLTSIGGAGSTLETNTIGTLDGAGYPLNIQASLAGKGIFRVIGAAGSVITLPSPSLSFTGDLLVAGAEVQLLSSTALGNAGRVVVKSGKFKPTVPTSLPNTILLQSGGGVVSLTSSLSVATAVLSDVVVPAGTYTVANLVALGIPGSALEDGGGTLTVSGALDVVDSDGDGVSDLAEAFALTNAHDATSRLRFSSLATDGAGTNPAVRLIWPTVPGLTYRLDFTIDLTTSWFPAATITATAISTEFLDSTYAPAYPQAGFYRLVVVP
jgi:hypothetical protein